jgi:hypothetical protein
MSLIARTAFIEVLLSVLKVTAPSGMASSPDLAFFMSWMDDFSTTLMLWKIS